MQVKNLTAFLTNSMKLFFQESHESSPWWNLLSEQKSYTGYWGLLK